MLKIGIILLFVSSVGVFSRIADFAFSAGPYTYHACLFGLSVSLTCFIATILKAEASAWRKRAARAPMLKSPAYPSTPLRASI